MDPPSYGRGASRRSMAIWKQYIRFNRIM
jgi:hypothetical protein